MNSKPLKIWVVIGMFYSRVAQYTQAYLSYTRQPQHMH